jgi:hypothetical protein
MDRYIIGTLVFLGLHFASRFISDRATKHLNQEKKAELLDLFSGTNKYSMVLLIALVLLYFLSIRNQWFDPALSYVVYVSSLLIFLLTMSYFSYKKLSTHNFPRPYIKSYLLATFLRVLGVGALFFVLSR